MNEEELREKSRFATAATDECDKDCKSPFDFYPSLFIC